jgi:DegV family protein with EDD domain
MEKDMEDYVICIDAAGDLDSGFRTEHQIEIIPMDLCLGEHQLSWQGTEKEETLHAIYESQRQKALTKTTQVTPFSYERFFEPLLRKKKSILYLALTSGLSSTYQSASLAAEELQPRYPDLRIIPIDSLGATGGIGVLAERAQANKEKGMSLEENAADLKEARQALRHWFMVEDLMYLCRGGRISLPEAALGSLLSFKPILRINPEGKLESIDKKRGRKQGFRCLLDLFEAHYDPKLTQVVYICHADCLPSASYLTEEIQKSHPGIVIREKTLSPIIGAHTGPDMVSILHLGK